MKEYPYRAKEAVDALIKHYQPGTLLNVGAGDCAHTDVFSDAGFKVTSIDKRPQRKDVLLYTWQDYVGQFDYVWASHIMEHTNNVALFLHMMRRLCKPKGTIIITVPPAKHEIVGGHLTIWNMGLLFYNLVYAGFDCRESRAKEYGYNISVFQQNVTFDVPELKDDEGDIETLAEWFPFPVRQGFDGRIKSVNWFEAVG